jgi:hypothetical protein
MLIMGIFIIMIWPMISAMPKSVLMWSCLAVVAMNVALVGFVLYKADQNTPLGASSESYMAIEVKAW